MKFKKFADKLIPENIELKNEDGLQNVQLVYIPWNDKYLKYVPNEWQNFFLTALPYMHVRTTDVHTAICTSYIDKIIKLYDQPINNRVVALGLILHDVGWSALSRQDIIDSLSDYKGLKLSQTTQGSKKRHAEEGVKIAQSLLDKFDFYPPLSSSEKQEILDIVLYHDTTAKLSANGQLATDLDRLWSFTQENFWQDTIRKDISPEEYLVNLKRDSRTYFSTKAGLTIATDLLQDRAKEIEQIK